MTKGCDNFKIIKDSKLDLEKRFFFLVNFKEDTVLLEKQWEVNQLKDNFTLDPSLCISINSNLNNSYKVSSKRTSPRLVSFNKFVKRISEFFCITVDEAQIALIRIFLRKVYASQQSIEGIGKVVSIKRSYKDLNTYLLVIDYYLNKLYKDVADVNLLTLDEPRVRLNLSQDEEDWFYQDKSSCDLGFLIDVIEVIVDNLTTEKVVSWRDVTEGLFSNLKVLENLCTKLVSEFNTVSRERETAGTIQFHLAYKLSFIEKFTKDWPEGLRSHYIDYLYKQVKDILQLGGFELTKLEHQNYKTDDIIFKTNGLSKELSFKLAKLKKNLVLLETTEDASKLIYQSISLIILILTKLHELLNVFNVSQRLSLPIVLENINITSSFRVLLIELLESKNPISGDLACDRSPQQHNNFTFSLTPYKVMKHLGVALITNGSTNITINAYSTGDNKFYPSFFKEGDSKELEVLRRQCAQGLRINKEYLEILTELVNNVFNVDDACLQSLGFSEQTIQSIRDFDNKDVSAFLEYVRLLESFSIKVVFFPWYYDFRYRLYCFSSVNPTASRLFRYIYYLEDSPQKSQDNLSICDYFKNLSLDVLSNYPYVGGTTTEKEHNALPEEERSIIIALQLFKSLVEDRIKTLSTGSLTDLYKHLDYNFSDAWPKRGLRENPNSKVNIMIFVKVLKKTNYSVKDSLELFYLLFLLEKINYKLPSLNLRDLVNYLIIVDITASALVLISIILGPRNPKILNISENNFKKIDTYSVLKSIFWSQLGNKLDPKAQQFIGRKVYKNSIMTINYGAKKSPTIKRISLNLGLCLSSNNSNILTKDFIKSFAYLLYYSLSGKEKDRDYLRTNVPSLKGAPESFFNDLLLENHLFQESIGVFQAMARYNLLINMGIIKVNNLEVSIAYHKNQTRIKSKVLKSSGTRVGADNYSISSKYWSLSKVSWPKDVCLNELELVIFSSRKFKNSDLAELINKFPVLAKLNDKQLEKFAFIREKLLPNLEKFSNGFRANVIHSIDSCVVREIISRVDYQIITIHDAFGLPLLKYPHIVLTYNEVLSQLVVEINDSPYKLNILIKDNLPFN